MTRMYLLRLATVGLVLGCGTHKETPANSMANMTPAEMAKMGSGGNQGAIDSAGMLARQPVHLTPADERAMGVVYTTVDRETLTKTVRTVGEVLTPEPNLTDVTPKVGGFVEHLFADATGAAVRRGEPLLALYSPQLVSAQEEFLVALRLAARMDSSSGEAWHSAQATLSAARRRLAYWDISAAQIAQLEQSGTVTKTLTLASPATGIVLRKDVVEGQQVVAGQRLYQIADLRDVWVEGEVFEQDLQLLRDGAQAHIEIAGRPGEHLMGRVSFIYPTMDVRSRTNKVRLTMPNPGLQLKPGMYATIFFDVVIGRDVVAIPQSAVIVTGERNVVFVRGADGMLRSQEVVLGPRAGEKVQVLDGLVPGQVIVSSANFLVDAESRLASPGDNMPGMQHAIPGGGKPIPEPGHAHDR